jgi:cytochrome c peroxidase
MNSLRNLKLLISLMIIIPAIATDSMSGHAQNKESVSESGNPQRGKLVFERKEFGGNGRTCLTCHNSATGTVSPEEAQARFAVNPQDPLFLHDGSDDGQGNGFSRMLADATIRVGISLPENVSLADDPQARSVVLHRGIPTTLNTPALDKVLMSDGRQPDLESQAFGAVQDHYQSTATPSQKDMLDVAAYEQTDSFFSSKELRKFALGGPAPKLPQGKTASEKRGRLFFEDVPITSPTQKAGLCAACHSGPMLNESSALFPLFPPGTRFTSVLVSELNTAGNPMRSFVFRNTDGTTETIFSPDPGRALITGNVSDANSFKIPTLWGVRHTAPYFHDNSAKTLEDLVRHYALFFEIVTGPTNPIILTEQDMADIVAYLKLLN